MLQHGNTALHEASWKGYSRSVAVLGKARANLHLKNCGGFAALHLCCQNGHNQSCRELLLAGCNPDLQNNYGDTPLHTSARYGHAGVTRILISAQCRVSDQNKNGDTALHIAAAMGRRKLTRILLEAGCDKNLKNKQNETARDIATRKDLNEILVILNSPSATQPKTKLKKNGHEKDHNDKKRGKNESGTSSKDSSSRQKDKKKGPVGVGYTCYCAPFFRHMEARLDRDKQELKEHIDQAHQRLDQKVTNLERRTQGQLSELTRCVVAERALCDQRHLHLAQWLNRGTAVRNSERVRGTETQEVAAPIPVPRARSMEQLLDRQVEWRNQQQADITNGNATGINKGLRNGQDHRSLEMLADDESITSWRRDPHRNSAHEHLSRDKTTRRSDNTYENSKSQGQSLQTYAHELALRVKQGFQKGQDSAKFKPEHNKSFEDLLDKDVSSWRSQPLRRSAHEIPVSRTNNESTNGETPNFLDRHNRSFDTLLDQRSGSWKDQPQYRSVNELPASQHQRAQNGVISEGLSQSQIHNRSFDMLVDKGTTWTDEPQCRRIESHNGQMEDEATGHSSPSWKEKMQQETKEIEDHRHSDSLPDGTSPDWRGQPLRRSVHEMVARFQSAQSGQVIPNWKIQNKSKSVIETTKFLETKHNEQPKLSRYDGRRDHDWQNQICHRSNPTWQEETVAVHGADHYRCHDDNSSESSDGEDGEDEVILGIPKTGNPDYENVVASCPWRAEDNRLMSGLPYRSRSAVYSPTHEPADLHNDSGYSTKLYGSSKGPSPSLSGQLECESILPGQNVFPPNKLPNLCDHPAPGNNVTTRSRYHDRGEDTGTTNIVAASLV
ncbi:hypothetical protein C0J52_27204 [Blattella germanica]|nr:hypothetical protein C0J52_27204 [Blattella germanica]